MEEENTKRDTKTWIMTLVVSSILLALTFTVVANFLADIRNSAHTLLERTDMIAQRMVVIDTGMSNLQRQLMPLTPPTANAAPPSTAAVIEQPSAPSTVTGTLKASVAPEGVVAPSPNAAGSTIQAIVPVVKPSVATPESAFRPEVSTPAMVPAQAPVAPTLVVPTVPSGK